MPLEGRGRPSGLGEAEEPAHAAARARFEQRDAPVDDLGLTARVNEALREHAALGDQAIFLHADTPTMAGALRLAGRYVVEDGTVRVTAWVHRGLEQLARFEESAPAADLDRLVDALLRGVAGAAK